MSIRNKIDFAVIFTVDHANPNGDPLNGNRPRVDYDGYGEISDVCIKRKIRNQAGRMGENILVQPDDMKTDGMPSLQARAESDSHGIGKAAFDGSISTREETARMACAKWWDVRAFGQLFAFEASGKPKGRKKGKDAKEGEESEAPRDAGGVSLGIRGPVTIRQAVSVEPVTVSSMQIVKSVNSSGDASGKASDTMGLKHCVERGVYVFFGSISPALAERTGFDEKDAGILKDILPRLFENDASASRPDGSMAVKHVFWWDHGCASGRCSSSRVHGSLKVAADGSFEIDPSVAEGMRPEILPGF